MNFFAENLPALLNGAIGVVLGAVVTSFVAWRMLKKQLYYESNRYFVHDLIRALQKIYAAQLSQSEITDDDLNKINAFQVLSFKEFEVLQHDLEELKDAILQYRDGREKTLESTTSSMEEIQAKKKIEAKCRALITKIRKLT